MNPSGAISLFKDIFEQPRPIEKSRKGRSLSLIEKRNELLLARYYWHGRKKIEGKTISYSSLLETVSNEFFLSMVTIPEIVDANYDMLSALKRQWHDEPEEKMQKAFAKKWPHFVW